MHRRQNARDFRSVLAAMPDSNRSDGVELRKSLCVAVSNIVELDLSIGQSADFRYGLKHEGRVLEKIEAPGIDNFQCLRPEIECPRPERILVRPGGEGPELVRAARTHGLEPFR